MNGQHHEDVAKSRQQIEIDLTEILSSTGCIWSQLQGATLFITGGTGFIGSWILEGLRWANLELGLNIPVSILTRDEDRFRREKPHLAQHPSFTLISGDVKDFSSPQGDYSHIIHAATESSYSLNTFDPKLMYDTIVNGTLRVLDFAVEKRSDRVLLLSSGAVYGEQPTGMRRLREEWLGSPDLSDAGSAYAEGKRGAEVLATIYGKQFGLNVVTARIFALLGPYLPLDAHYAVGNFVRDALEGRSITVNGSGSPVRSYLYTSDLMVWLWTLLVAGRPGESYNVGSENEISLRSLAALIADTIGQGEYQVLGKDDVGINPGRYVPDTTRIREELNLRQEIPLDEAIRRTATWHGWKGNS
jgi:nucleoside-diphosphate-sugar epimerase